MSIRQGCVRAGFAVGIGLFWSTPALSQTAPPEGPAPAPPSAAFPEPTPDPAAAPVPAAAPAPTPAPSYEATTAPGSAQPAYAEPPLPYPPPPPEKPDEGFEMPSISLRVDPFNWLLGGRLGFELESQVWKFISVELVPVFVTSERPPALKSVDTVTQHSNGIGSLSGASIGAGFWLSGKGLRGTVLRVILTNHGYTYRARDDIGQFDEVSHTERRLFGYLGSHSVWGGFTLAGGIGLGVELNRQERCFDDDRPTTEGCKDDELNIATVRGAFEQGNLHSWSYPVELMFRFSLGVTLF